MQKDRSEKKPWVYYLEGTIVLDGRAEDQLIRDLLTDLVIRQEEAHGKPENFEMKVSYTPASNNATIASHAGAKIRLSGMGWMEAEAEAKGIHYYFDTNPIWTQDHWDVVAVPGDGTEIDMVLYLTTGFSEARLVSSMTWDDDQNETEAAALLSTTGDLINHHLLTSTVGDPNLSLIQDGSFQDDIYLACEAYAPAIRPDPYDNGDMLRIGRVSGKHMIDWYLLQHLDEELNRYKDAQHDHLTA